MTNAVYTLIVRALSGIVSERAAETLLRAALREQGLTAEGVTAGEMQRVLSGPLLTRLSGVLPPERARAELGNLAAQLQKHYPKAPTLFSSPAATWDETTSTHWEDIDFSADDFEFDDPEYTATPPERQYALGTAAGQEALIQDLGRIPGVQGVMVCRASGEVLRERALSGSRNLSSVIAATALLFQKRALNLMSADMGGQTVCMRPVGAYCVAVVAGPQVNIGRLLAELQQVREAA
ncbi:MULTISPECIES: roadblock/LC7 domain-containing protein [Deinococcus]|uniref:Roadblock/LC7 n=1 Tax=Deinococcus geothermalis (strain DSM 11300 / CIP 105573 / AG-3a) TaxID=319795 RepID=Q1J2C5_DEIGD|nr:MULTISPECIES: roadblock/LC7 domain-containing protein [Deinococcus]ABF44359.1 Roadblock/LC7 [Deinococcus geothermalis DSM 11300]TDE86485.1 roadblock/LC7 domain-containing protein [Deinococcus sp. S9]